MFVVGYIVNLLLNGRIDSPTEVAYLQYVETVKNIFRFNVSMNYRVAVQIPSSIRHLSEVE
jgi:hypothetical protein